MLPGFVLRLVKHGDGVAIKGWAIPSALTFIRIGDFILFGGLPLSLKRFYGSCHPR